jgi:hypothetical protein
MTESLASTEVIEKSMTQNHEHDHVSYESLLMAVKTRTLFK